MNGIATFIEKDKAYFLTIVFSKSKSCAFGTMTMIAKMSDFYSEVKQDEQTFYCANFSNNYESLSKSLELIRLTNGLKGVFYFINGNSYTNELLELYQTMKCYINSLKSINPKNFCIGEKDGYILPCHHVYCYNTLKNDTGVPINEQFYNQMVKCNHDWCPSWDKEFKITKTISELLKEGC